VRQILQAAHRELTMQRWNFLTKIGKASCFRSLSREWGGGEERRGIVFNTEYLLYSEERVSLLERITEPSQRLLMSERRENSGSANEFYR